MSCCGEEKTHITEIRETKIGGASQVRSRKSQSNYAGVSEPAGA